MAYRWTVLLVISSVVNASDIPELLVCNPPDYPTMGGYGPVKSDYLPGDMIHYYCDTEAFMEGSFLRKCEDTGDWSGHTPACDHTTAFSSFSQSSDADDESEAELAIDGLRNTCSRTAGGQRDEWTGTFTKPGELIRVMLFLPKGPVSYEVLLIKPNGEEVVCGSRTGNNVRHNWFYHSCPEPHNAGASGVKIKSLSNKPLIICEIAAYVLTSPKCVDPHLHINNGRLRLDRKSATLSCNKGYTRGSDDKLECIRDGVWNRKSLFCMVPQWLRNEDDGIENRNL